MQALLLNNNEVVSAIDVRVLESVGFRTQTAESSKALLELISLERFDLIIINREGSNENTSYLVGLIRRFESQNQRDAAVIVVTCHPVDKVDEVELEVAGTDAILLRPFDFTQLEEVLNLFGFLQKLSPPA